jgi:RimJ/RimL family protein N-acetyltransferase
VARRAIAAAAGLGFGEFALRKIGAGIYASNRGSLRAFERAGFAVEAVLRAQRLLDGRPEDEIRMAKFAATEKTQP